MDAGEIRSADRLRKPGPSDAGTQAARTRAEHLRHCLEEEILQGALAPGTRLDEASLAERFEVSRTPVREALKYLASSGLVAVRPHQGAVVTRLTVKQLIDMFQVMAELEGLCARLAARRLTPDDRARLLDAHRGCEAVARHEDPEAFYRQNNVFHEVIYAASGNDYLEEETRMLRNRLGPYRRYITFQPGRIADSLVEHQRIVDAMLAADDAAAHDQMRLHLDVLAGDLAKVISALEPRAATRVASR